MQAIRYRWNLSSDYPYVLRYYSQSNAAMPPPDMHEAAHFAVYTNAVRTQAVIGQTPFVFKTGDKWLTAPWEPHAFCSKEQYSFWLFTFDVRSMSRLFPREAERFQQLLHSPPELRMKLLKDFPEIPENLPVQPVRSACWLGMGALLAEWVGKTSGVYLPVREFSDRLIPALEALRSGTIVPLPLKHAAALCGLNVCQFNRLFKNSFGQTYGAFERYHRLMLVASELADGPVSGKELAEKYGFTDKSHLTRCFRKHFGVPPGAYCRNGRAFFEKKTGHAARYTE